ncbi:MAG: phosphoribosylanthranilate isomerase [Candidatus Peribacteraceae bacterium]|nr:phosphoribosylanthranilate isomerase [Candidatus Peribacteraceae bacterium]
MRPRIKFCGMTRGVDIDAAVALGVEYIGFVFAASSKRSVTINQAMSLRSHVRSAKTVGVFTDHSVDEIENHARELTLDVVQLHGEPDLQKAKALSVPVIQAFRGVPDASLLEGFLAYCPYILIDKAEGEGTADIPAIAALPERVRSKMFLAGGLTHENLRSASDAICPFAVDTARGIETRPGIKDHDRMSAFFSALS